MVREGSNSPFLSASRTISASQNIDRLMVKEWLKEKSSECWTAACGMNQWKHFIERPSYELY
jgi:hypothetical protein